jgi:hypothetical protein
MRKLFLISAFVVASASAQASDIGRQRYAGRGFHRRAGGSHASSFQEAGVVQLEQEPGQPARDRRAKRAPYRRPVWHLLVMRGFIIVAVMFWLALSYQNNHRDFGPAKVETVR